MSGRKNTLPSYQNFNNAAMGVATITSPVTDIQHMDNIGVQLNFTGTPTGAFNVQISIDQVNWINLTLSPAPTAAGAPNQIYIDINQISAPFIRVQYVGSSGSGVLNSFITGKML